MTTQTHCPPLAFHHVHVHYHLVPLQKRMRLKQLPPVLCLHLKRFKYIEQLGRCGSQQK